MRRDFIIIGVVIFLVSFGFFWWTNINVEEKFTISATKVGTHSAVFKKYVSGQVEKVLEFEEAIAADDSGNYWASLPVSVSLSPDSTKLAYIDTQGLKIRNLNDGQEIILIERTGQVRDSVKESYDWNPPIENAGSIHKPSWSSDGKYVSFLIAQYEGSRLGVVNVAERKLIFGPRSQRQSWSRVGNSLLLVSGRNDCDGCEDKILVLNAETERVTEISKDVFSLIEKKYLPE